LLATFFALVLLQSYPTLFDYTLSFALHMRNIKWQALLKRNEACLNCTARSIYQLGPINSERAQSSCVQVWADLNHQTIIKQSCVIQ